MPKGGHGLGPTRRNTGRAGSGRGPARPVDENPGPWAKPVGRINFEQQFYSCFHSIKANFQNFQQLLQQFVKN